MFTTRFILYLGILSCIPVVMSQTNITAYVGNNVSLPCLVTGTYVLPGWASDSVTINYEGSTNIHPNYVERFRIDPNDQKSLQITDVQKSDEGMYECTHSLGTSSAKFTGLIVYNQTTESKNKEETNGKKVQTANCVFYPPDMVVVTVVIIICSYILINAYKERKHNNKMEDKQNNKMEDKHNNKMEDKQNENKKKKKIKVVVILTIVEVLLFITVSVWFIVIQATVEDFEKLTTTEHIVTIILLVVEIVVFVQGVIAIFVFWKNRGSANKSNAEGLMLNPNPRNIDHHNCLTSTKKEQEPNQQATFI